MVGATRGFSWYSPTPSTGAPGAVASVGDTGHASTTLLEVIRGLSGSSSESIERGKTIFFPGDPAERVYLLRRGAVRLSRVYESGEEITVALLRENSLFGVLSLLTGQRSDRFYHAIAFTRVEMVTAPGAPVEGVGEYRLNPRVAPTMKGWRVAGKLRIAVAPACSGWHVSGHYVHSTTK